MHVRKYIPSGYWQGDRKNPILLHVDCTERLIRSLWFQHLRQLGISVLHKLNVLWLQSYSRYIPLCSWLTDFNTVLLIFIKVLKQKCLCLPRWTNLSSLSAHWAVYSLTLLAYSVCVWCWAKQPYVEDITDPSQQLSDIGIIIPIIQMRKLRLWIT